MIEYDQMFYNVTLNEYFLNETLTDGRDYTFKDFCKEFNYTYSGDPEDEPEEDEYVWPGAKCFATQKPIDFVYVKHDDAYRMDLYDNDAELLYKVRTGKGDPNIYTTYYSLFINLIFAATSPDEVD